MPIAVLVSGAFVIATVHRNWNQVGALAGLHLMLNWAASALSCVIGTVTRIAVGAAESSASWIADGSFVRFAIDVRAAISSSRATEFFLLDDCTFSSDLLNVDAEWQRRAERRFGALCNNQLTFLTIFRTCGHFARIATFAHWALSDVIDCETVIASEPAEKTGTFALRVVT